MKWRFKKIAIDIGLIISVVILSFTMNSNIKSVMGEVKEEQPIFSVDTEEKVISLTFDINWAEKDNLESILNILDKYNVKGTFFIMGGWVNYERYLHIAEQSAQEGLRGSREACLRRRTLRGVQ